MEPLFKKIKDNIITNVMVAVILGGLAISFNAVKGFVKKPAYIDKKVDSVIVLHNDLSVKYDDVLKEIEKLKGEDVEIKGNMNRVLDVLIK